MTERKSRFFGKKRYFWLLFLMLVCFYVNFFSPARAITYGILTPHLNTASEDIVLFDYLVYGTERRFNEGLSKDVPKIKEQLQERGEGVVIMIPGEASQQRKYDCIIIRDESVPELNIEFYISKTVEFSFGKFPFRTVELLLEDLLKNILIYLAFYIFLAYCFFCFRRSFFIWGIAKKL